MRYRVNCFIFVFVYLNSVPPQGITRPLFFFFLFSCLSSAIQLYNIIILYYIRTADSATSVWFVFCPLGGEIPGHRVIQFTVIWRKKIVFRLAEFVVFFPSAPPHVNRNIHTRARAKHNGNIIFFIYFSFFLIFFFL